MRRTAGGNGVGVYPVASRVRRNPESRAPGQTGRACRSWVRRTLRRNAPQAGLPGHRPQRGGPAVSVGRQGRDDARPSRVRRNPFPPVLRHHLRARLAGAEEPPEKTTSPMTHGRVPRGCGGTCLAASQPFDQRVLAGTEDPRPRRTGGRGVSLAVRMSLLQAGARDGAARVLAGAEDPPSHGTGAGRSGRVPRGCGGPSERPMSLRRRTLRPEESRSRKSPVSGGKGGAFSERPVSWGAARGRPQQAFFGGGSGLFYGASRKAAPPFAAEGAARDGSRRDCGAASRRGRCRTSRSDASSRLLNAAFGKAPSGAGVSVKGRLVAKPG